LIDENAIGTFRNAITTDIIVDSGEGRDFREFCYAQIDWVTLIFAKRGNKGTMEIRDKKMHQEVLRGSELSMKLCTKI
jgi:hypothetical protein